MASNMETTMSCDYKSGLLDYCAPLAAAYIPFQEVGSPKYEANEGQARGTLFPGLDLPFKNIVTKSNPANTPLGELMALGFAINELGLYLDTHEDDSEALKLYTSYVSMYKEGVEKYVKMYGPLMQTQVTNAGYTWLNNPWPWENSER